MYFPLFIIILIITKTNSDKVEDSYTDLMNCMDTDTNSCSSVSLKTKNLECCLVSIDYYSSYYRNSDINSCVAIYSNYLSDDMKETVEALAKEEFGVIQYWNELNYFSFQKFTTTYKCKSKSATFTFGGYDYTSSEIEILKADNNCFKLYFYTIADMFGLSRKNVDKNDCMNAKILDSTKKAKISCGFSEFTILWSDNTNTDFNSCFYLPKTAIKAKQLDAQTESYLDQMERYLQSREGKTSKSYKVRITDADGNVLIYDSATGTVSNSNFIKVKSLVLLIFLAFIF